MKKILLLGLQTDANLGDALIAQCTEWLARKACDELNIRDVQFETRDFRGVNYREQQRDEAQQRAVEAQRRALEAQRQRNSPRRRILRALSRCVPTALKNWLHPNREAEREAAKLAKAVEQQRMAQERQQRRIDEADANAERCAIESITADTAAVIFVGGGLIKFGHQRLPRLMSPYVRRADELGIPLMFNAVGVEGFDAQNDECARLVELLNKKCVKSVTVRDDIDLLRSHYIQTGIHTAKVADPACWTSDVYPRECGRSGMIGLGMLRGRLFEDHGVPFSEEQLLTLWSQVIALLESRGHDWRLFCNGLESDWQSGRKLLERIGRMDEADTRILPCPATTAELIDTISGFGGIIAGRLHSAIVARAYGIPAVEPVWNVKQRLFGEQEGVPERFVELDELCAETLVERLETAMAAGNPPIPLNTREATYAELKSFLVGLGIS